MNRIAATVFLTTLLMALGGCAGTPSADPLAMRPPAHVSGASVAGGAGGGGGAGMGGGGGY